jgi:predicted nucleic acid-binding protein
MIIVDSSYLLAIAKKFDSLHLRATAIKFKIEKLPLLYLDDVLKEVQTVLAIKKSNLESFAWIDSIYKNELDIDRQYNLSSLEYFEVLNFWRSLKNSNLSFVDAEILYLAQKYNFQVLSFDEELLKLLPPKLRLN